MNIKSPKGRFHFRREELASSCGQIIIYLTINGVFSRGRTCKDWACINCVEIKIKEIIDCLEQKITGPHVFASEIGFTKKRLDNWITREKPKDPGFFYYALQMYTGKTILISNYRFPIEYDRRPKIGYLKSLRSYLLEHHDEIEKTSRSIIRFRF